MQIIDINANKNKPKAWFLAARPKTLSGAAVPVMIGGAYAWHLVQDVTKMEWTALLLCFLFAFIMQIDANFINDYYDCVRGRDNQERLGPERACQQGWVTLSAMRKAIALTTILACLVGLPLVLYGGWQLVIVGLVCVIFCFLYTVCLAQLGMGDVLVLLFFGIIPTVCTTYVTVHSSQFTVHSLPWSLGIATGMVIDCLLLVNNYRDIDNDKHSGKRTLVVLIGKKWTEYLYMMLTPVALVIVLLEFGFSNTNILLCFIVYFLHINTWNKMKRIEKGRELNKVLGLTARNIFIYGVVTSIIILGI
ncbi:MAG: 1,4-dihydroxy-2-naphthoate octaprenyltransferase [Prevotella sp.]|nr:1,4-dihydroxy-2-naphthoate octaprenyltransferase [Prevotella sp.]